VEGKRRKAEESGGKAEETRETRETKGLICRAMRVLSCPEKTEPACPVSCILCPHGFVRACVDESRLPAKLLICRVRVHLPTHIHAAGTSIVNNYQLNHK
jgi:hypothetical protein